MYASSPKSCDFDQWATAGKGLAHKNGTALPDHISAHSLAVIEVAHSEVLNGPPHRDPARMDHFSIVKRKKQQVWPWRVHCNCDEDIFIAVTMGRKWIHSASRDVLVRSPGSPKLLGLKISDWMRVSYVLNYALPIAMHTAQSVLLISIQIWIHCIWKYGPNPHAYAVFYMHYTKSAYAFSPYVKHIFVQCSFLRANIFLTAGTENE